MSFLNASMLGWLALGAIPIIIYLINRQRFKRIWWAAMEFLLRAMKKNRRRLRIENLLLLIIRTLIVLLLVLAVARPVLQRGFLPIGTSKRKHVVLVLDNSYSMGYKVGASSCFDRAKDWLKRYVDKDLLKGDRVLLCTMNEGLAQGDRQARYVGGDSDKKMLKAQLDAVELSNRGTDAVKLLSSLLLGKDPVIDRLEAPDEEKLILIATDMQEEAWTKQGGLEAKELREAVVALAKKKTRLVLVDVGEEEAVNVAVTKVLARAQSNVVGVRTPVKILAEVRNHSSREFSGTITFTSDEVPQETRRITVPPNKSETVHFNCEFPVKGAHSVTARIATDPLAVDNKGHLVVNVRSSVNVLVVNGKPSPQPIDDEVTNILAAYRVLQKAGGPPGGEPLVDYEEKTVGEFEEMAVGGSRMRLEDFDAIVIANVGSVTQDTRDALNRYVEGGGGVLWFLGDRVDPVTMNDLFWEGGDGLLPFQLLEVFPQEENPRNRYALVVEREEHPVFKEMLGGRPEVLERPRIDRYMRSRERSDKHITVLARATGQDRAPIIVERMFGKGCCIFVHTSASPEWNNWCCFQFLPLFLYYSTYYLSGRGGARRNILVGEPFSIRVPANKVSNMAVSVVLPTKEQPLTISLKAPEQSGGRQPDYFSLFFDKTNLRGVYQFVFNAGEWSDLAAANLRTDESCLKKLYEGDFRAAFPQAYKDELLRITKGAERGAEESDIGGKGRELWRTLLYMVVFLLAAEMILAVAFGRRQG